MSNEVEGTVPIITAPKKDNHVKNPKRVAQGKKLVEISKQAKARKKAEQENAEKYTDGESCSFSNVSDYSYMALAGLALTAIGTYYGCKPYYNSNKVKEPVGEPKHVERGPERRADYAFRLLDTID